MDVLKRVRKMLRPADSYAVVFVALAAVYALVWGTPVAVAIGAAFGLIVYGVLPKQMTLALLVAASVILLLQRRRGNGLYEGFADAEKAEKAAEKAAEEKAAAEKADKASDVSGEMPVITAAFTNPDGSGKKVMLPDNADRKEPLVLGKPYKLPSEGDDKGYHLDAGTTFLNAYKALKPDQIAAMTRDTQELLATQKSLMGMLDSFGPLMKDMGKITGFFNQVPAAAGV
jgi:hypothetical protein